jgi:hypothetical protein
VADVFGPASTALSMRKVAERALEHDDEEVRPPRESATRGARAQPGSAPPLTSALHIGHCVCWDDDLQITYRRIS